MLLTKAPRRVAAMVVVVALLLSPILSAGNAYAAPPGNGGDDDDDSNAGGVGTDTPTLEAAESDLQRVASAAKSKVGKLFAAIGSFVS